MRTHSASHVDDYLTAELVAVADVERHVGSKRIAQAPVADLGAASGSPDA